MVFLILDAGEALKRRNNDLCSGGGTLRRGQLSARSPPCNVDDLIHLAGPLTEDAVLKTLQARFYADEFFVSRQILFILFLEYIYSKRKSFEIVMLDKHWSYSAGFQSVQRSGQCSYTVQYEEYCTKASTGPCRPRSGPAAIGNRLSTGHHLIRMQWVGQNLCLDAAPQATLRRGRRWTRNGRF